MIVLPDQDPLVITPLLTTIPERLDGNKLDKNKLPPIPTPPEIVNAPVYGDVDEVELDIIKSFVNVLIPPNDCESVETKPVDAIPAIGILKVCVLPKELMLNEEP